ncbi:MAG TPA: bifunctional 4-hydroxy-2-oxoglutarate aldolase/2-dehydro-3-deoxy-phosphogluconate aldolase [Rugosimonospora sp.]|nr:bifunctional 4-hydroxy-2-oxoglutarate aldolase/2-dehydro-3-deoxy-phosphogluconate aldolase [Rugosimonospora sp.]
MAYPLAGPVVAILRSRHAEHLDRVLDTLLDAGVASLEVTLNTPGALDCLRRFRDRLPDGVRLGAGTVRRVSDVDEAVAAGATFLVSPHTDPVLVARARELGVDYLPGALTPTEVAAAWALRPRAVKLFPARQGGPRYLRDLLEPLDDVALVPTGGVTIETVGDWFAAGAAAVGLGSPLLGDALETGDVRSLRERADRLATALAEVAEVAAR